MKKNKNKRSSQRIDTLIGPGSEMEGILQCENNLRIDGRFNGSIESQGCVIVGEEGIARSDISAREIIVAGKVYGNVQADSKLTITPTGQMYGDVYAASLIIMEGGLLNGGSRMELQSSNQADPESTETSLPVQRPEAG